MDPGVSDSHGGVFANKVYATLEIRVCSRNYQCTPAGKINSIDSRVHGKGHFMLKPDPTTRHYILYLLVPSFSSSRGCLGRELGGMINVYNLLLYIVATTSATLLPLLLYFTVGCFLPHAARLVGRC